VTNADFLELAMEHAERARAAGAPIRPAAAVAHSANEAAWGTSRLTVDANNLFGLKATGQHTPFWSGDSVEMPTWEVIDGKNVTVKARFRAYPSWAASFGDYGDVIRRVYPRAAEATSDVAFLARIFNGPGPRWATDPAAFSKACRILADASDTLTPDPASMLEGEARTLVLHNLTPADRWVALTRGPVVLRGSFPYRVRGTKIDIRRG